MVLTNVNIYKAIAHDAYRVMREALARNRRAKPGGNPGWIVTLDSDQTSFKHAMVVIVFTGMWIEALAHLVIVRDHGVDAYKKYDRRLSYERKLEIIGCADPHLLARAKRLRKVRKSLVHEKAYLEDGDLQIAQSEADNAYQLLRMIERSASRVGRAQRNPPLGAG